MPPQRPVLTRAQVDSYKPSFLNAGGDCDSKVCSAMDVCFTYLRDTWVPFMAVCRPPQPPYAMTYDETDW